MSQQLFEEDVVFYQRLLKCMGYYGAALDARTERNIFSMHIKTQREIRQFMSELAEQNFGRDVKVISGTRTYAQQNKLFTKGRFGNPGPKVTNARGGFSNHNFGIAWDIGLFDNGRYLTGSTNEEVQWYKDVAASVDLTGLAWGGNWVSFVDLPHYQMATEFKISDVREKFEVGIAYI